MSREQVDAFNRLRKPIVFLRDKPDAVQANSIWVDDLVVGQMATQHLLDLGHRRIVVMLSEPPNPSSTSRLHGWSIAMKKKGLKQQEALIVDCSVRPGKDSLQGSYERFSAWLETNRRPFTAIFCVAWTGALAALRALRERKILVPGKVSLITYDNESPISNFTNPPLTTVGMNVGKYAQEAIQLIQHSLSGPGKGEKQQILLKPDLIQRESTVPLKG